MGSGLSEGDRRRLQHGREQAAEKLAAERRRVAKVQAREARTREREAQRRLLLGPIEAIGPDGATAVLKVLPSGGWRVNFRSGSGDLIGSGEVIAIPVVIVVALVGTFSHWVLFRGGSTVHVVAAGRKRIKIRMRSQAAAIERMREIADSVRREGLATLDQ